MRTGADCPVSTLPHVKEIHLYVQMKPEKRVAVIVIGLRARKSSFFVASFHFHTGQQSTS